MKNTKLKNLIKNTLKEIMNKKPSPFKEKVSELYDLEEGPGCPKHCGKCGEWCESNKGYCDPCFPGAISKYACGVCRPTLGSSPHDKTKSMGRGKLREAENCGEQYCGRDKNGSHTYCTSHNYPHCDCCKLLVGQDDWPSMGGGGKQVKIRTSKTKGKN